MTTKILKLSAKYIYIVTFMFLIFSCGHEADELPSCDNDKLLYGFRDSLSSYFDRLIYPESQISISISHGYWDNIAKLNSGEEKIAYYETMNAGYQPGYSSLFDFEEVKIYTYEYVLSLDSILATMNPPLRKHLLSVAIDKHRRKFGVDYTTPFDARLSGILLVLSVLQYEKAQPTLDRICGYCSQHNLNDPMALASNDDFNDFLINEVSGYLTN